MVVGMKEGVGCRPLRAVNVVVVVVTMGVFDFLKFPDLNSRTGTYRAYHLSAIILYLSSQFKISIVT